MRLGILGGSFDPIHYGHLLVAESCREQLRLDQVWFLPAGVPPHKQQLELAPGMARIEMIELAIAGHPAFRVCPHEIDRGGVSYTVETLEHFRKEQPGAEMFLLLGADSLADLPSWREPARVCELATPAVVARGGHVFRDGQSLDLEGLSGVLSAERLAAIRQHVVEMPIIELSSTDIRGRVAQGRSIRYRTPRAVEMFIETHGLYRA